MDFDQQKISESEFVLDAAERGFARPSFEPRTPVQPYSRRAPAGGRPNMQISLRLPADWIMLLREQAMETSSRERRMITPQEIVRRIVARALSQPE